MANSARRWLALALLAVPTVACSKNDDASKAASVPPLPGAPAAAPAPAAPPPPPPVEAPPPAKPADPNATITGQITLPASMKAHVAPTDTLFLVARRIS